MDTPRRRHVAFAALAAGAVAFSLALGAPRGRAQDAAKPGAKRALTWERLETDRHTYRARIPGGWLVRAEDARIGEGAKQGVGLTFVPDPTHIWDGGSSL